MDSARALLEASAAWYDRSEGLRGSARNAWRGGFRTGGEWMGEALGELRGAPPLRSVRSLQRLGLAKYALALIPAALGARLLLPAAVPAFYVAEAQMAFVIPAALDGCPAPFAESRRLLVRAGGTWAALGTLLPIAAFMLLGGFGGQGFLRSWCLGCLAVCLWYERLRREPR